LEPEAARQQPSFTDGVLRVMAERNMPALLPA
jgi:hypothetical protein